MSGLYLKASGIYPLVSAIYPVNVLPLPGVELFTDNWNASAVDNFNLAHPVILSPTIYDLSDTKRAPEDTSVHDLPGFIVVVPGQMSGF